MRLHHDTLPITILLVSLAGLCLTSCPFQSPLHFKDDPVIQPVLDEFGNTMADQVRQDKAMINKLDLGLSLTMPGVD